MGASPQPRPRTWLQDELPRWIVLALGLLLGLLVTSQARAGVF